MHPRINFDGTLVVPPFECAWLGSSAGAFQSGSGCVCFEAKADNDVTIILKPLPGTKRVQPLQHASTCTRSPTSGTASAPAAGAGPYAPWIQQHHVQNSSQPLALAAQPTMATHSSTGHSLAAPAVEPNYTIIVGSHRNSCLKVEKNGTTLAMVQGVPGSHISSRSFSRFWVNYSPGIITVGAGEPSPRSPSFQWIDPEGPIRDIRHVGLSSWDSFVSYRCIQVLPPCRFATQPHQLCSMHGTDDACALGGGWLHQGQAVPTLQDLCSQYLIDLLSQPCSGQHSTAHHHQGKHHPSQQRPVQHAPAQHITAQQHHSAQQLPVPHQQHSTQHHPPQQTPAQQGGSSVTQHRGSNSSSRGAEMMDADGAGIGAAGHVESYRDGDGPQEQLPHACRIAQVAELLLPTTRSLYSACLAHMATNFKHIAAPLPAFTATQPSTADKDAPPSQPLPQPPKHSAAVTSAMGEDNPPSQLMSQPPLPNTAPKHSAAVTSTMGDLGEDTPPSQLAPQPPLPNTAPKHSAAVTSTMGDLGEGNPPLQPKTLKRVSSTSSGSSTATGCSHAVTTSSAQRRMSSGDGTQVQRRMSSGDGVQCSGAPAAEQGAAAGPTANGVVHAQVHQVLFPPQCVPDHHSSLQISTQPAQQHRQLQHSQVQQGQSQLQQEQLHSQLQHPQLQHSPQLYSQLQQEQPHSQMQHSPQQHQSHHQWPDSQHNHPDRQHNTPENTSHSTLTHAHQPSIPPPSPFSNHSLPPQHQQPPTAVSSCQQLRQLSPFEQLPASVLCDLLALNSVAAPEATIFEAVARWAAAGGWGWPQHAGGGCFLHGPNDAHDGSMGLANGGPSPPSAEELPARGASDVLHVLSLVRFPLMKPQELEEVSRHPLLVHHFPQVLPLVAEAAQPYSDTGCTTGPDAQTASNHPGAASGALAVKNRQLQLQPSSSSGELEAQPVGEVALLGNVSRFTRRAVPSCHECAYVCDGDANGVLHYIGTALGSQAWVNPVLAKRVAVRASSPAARHTDPKTLCGEKFQATHFAGPRYINGKPDTWWLLDLGPERVLSPTHYTIRHDASQDYVRSWALQGSTDGVSWIDLRRHINDVSIKRPAQYASWPVIGSAAQSAYRMFRLLLLGPTTSQERPYNFPLTYLELYGYVL